MKVCSEASSKLDLLGGQIYPEYAVIYRRQYDKRKALAEGSLKHKMQGPSRDGDTHFRLVR